MNIKKVLVFIVSLIIILSQNCSSKYNSSGKDNTDSSGTIFTISKENGFLPTKLPLKALPMKYSQVEELLQEMPVVKKDGKVGLLGKNKLAESVLLLPILDLSGENDTRVLVALFRDYTFLASAYIFEPCHHNLASTGELGLARPKLPRNLAIPLEHLSERLKVRPFLDYAYSYALLNWKMKDDSGWKNFENLNVIRSFTGHPSEAGFILVHVVMNQLTGRLVDGATDFLKSIEVKSFDACEIAMECILETMRHINKEMNTMWTRNNHEDYNLFRTFIFGIKNQPLLPDGLIYEGVSTEPRFYRGESGACDSIIPLMDNLLELTLEMPDNELTAILKDFRSCRPQTHQDFLKWAQEKATALKAKNFAVKANPILYLKLLDQVREFRDRHWNFVKVYIMQHTRYPVATGGSPIIKWLPNQLRVVYKGIQNVIRNLSTLLLNEKERKFSENLLMLTKNQETNLDEEVKGLTHNFTSSQKTITENHADWKSLY